jgi:uncharacterized protein (TIGR02147 family)
MSRSLFEFSNYKEYLKHALQTVGEGRGSRSRLAKFLKCQTAHISQVLKGKTDFSLEHAVRINTFLEHTEQEGHYFMLLLQKEKAGTKALADYYEMQAKGILVTRENLRGQNPALTGLSVEDQSRYYSAWYFAAIHILLSIPGFQTRAAIADHLQLAPQLVSDVLDFLVSVDLAVEAGNKIRIGSSQIQLNDDSPLLSKHHTNWRMRSIQSLDAPSASDLHYSLVVTLSTKDVQKIRTLMLEVIERSEPILQESDEEQAFCMALDFFQI